jgi:O-acetyl-ADP-ribose deacetylase (regulator of RNase III)
VIRYIIGDATRPVGDGPKIIAHVCNNKKAWGAGFVIAISRRWPQPERAYRALIDPKLTVVQLVRVETDIVVANMIAQDGFGEGDMPPIRYEALESCLMKVGIEAERTDASVHMPRIGCGLAGGSWGRVSAILESTLAGINVVVYDLKEPSHG